MVEYWGRIYEWPEMLSRLNAPLVPWPNTADVETGDLAEAAGHTTMNILLDH